MLQQGIVRIILAVAVLANVVLAACTRDTYTVLPAAPVFPATTLDAASTPSLASLVVNHWSEVAKMHRPAPVTPQANPAQTNCPHTTGTFVDFHSLNYAPNADIVLPANSRVLISSCSISPGTVYGKVTVPATSELIFGDAIINFQAKGILVYGKLLAGSATCRLRNKISITLHGSRNAQTLPGENWIKAINGIDATVEIHGSLYTPTWTRLAKTISPGDDLIFIQDMVNWQPGQTILVTTTELKDSRDYHRNEERMISQVFRTTVHANVSALRVTTPFTYTHYGGRSYQAEVGLLSRNIIIQGDATNSEPTDTANAICVSVGDSTYPCNDKYLTGFGANIRVEGSGTVARFEGVELFRVGQTNVLGRYPIHFHMIGQSVSTGNLYVKDCSVHRSYFRAYAIHGTNNVLISQNVAYDVIGHAYFLEDGVEEQNTFEYNFGSLVHWLGNSQKHDDSFGMQYSFWVNESPTLILPSDLGASVYYITNSYNNFLGNSASGGFSGFAFVNLPGPVKLHENYMNGQFTPMTRPLLLFKGNTAHSTAYWNQQLGGVYIGGTLKHASPGGPLTYTSGRDLERLTCAVDPKNGQGGWCYKPNHLWMVFEDTKVFLANRGFQHWGVRSEAYRTEVHDVSLSMNVFGTVYLRDVLVNCRSGEHVPISTCPSGNCKERDKQFFRTFLGFQSYDVGMNHMLDNFEFRNCHNQWSGCKYGPFCEDATVFETLTHSSRYVPEIMQASRNIKYTNVNLESIARFSVPNDRFPTISGRLAGWLDMDGSLFPGAFPAQPLIVGSEYGNKWWKTHEWCLGPKNHYYICPKGQDSSASIYISYNPTLEAQAMSETVCPNHYIGSCPIVGQATHFGRALSDGLDIGQNPKVTGPVIASAGGWYIRFTNGSPRVLKIQRPQIFPDANLVLAFPYPRGTTFSIKAKAPSWCSGWARMEEVLVQVNSLAEVRAGFGDRWFYDSTNQLLYFRVVQKNEDCFPANQATIPWKAETLQTLTGVFTRNGMSLMMMEQLEFHYEILATNCGGSGAYCGSLPAVVPPAVASDPVAPASTWAPTTPTLAPTGGTTCVSDYAICGSFTYTGCCSNPAFECFEDNYYFKQCRPRSPTTPSMTKSPTGTNSPTIAVPTSKSPTAPPTAPTTRAPTTLQPTSLRPTASPVSAAACTVVWGQCDGEGYQGPKCCQPGTVCVFDSVWYSQCLPVTAAPAGTTPTTKSPTSKAPTSKSPTSKAPTSKSPTSKAPTSKSPTSKAPTSKSPTLTPTTRQPTFRPTSLAPTKRPTTPAPTKRPTTRRPTKMPTTRRPTKKPTKAPTRKKVRRG